MGNIIKYQNPSSPLLDPHEIIKNVPAREWGPSKLIKSQEDVYPEFSINRINMPVRASNSGDGPGTDMIKAPFQYWGNKKLGEYNIELAKKTIEDFEKQSQDRDTIELDPNYSIYRDALNYIEHVEGLKKYLNLPYDVSVIRESKYKPTRLQNTNQKTYVFEESTKPGYWNDVVNDMVAESYDNHQYQDPTLNTFTAYRDFDEKGDFVSIYDEWDYNPAVIGGHKMLNKLIDSATGGKSFVVYDRIYLDDYYDIPKEARGNPFITPAIVTAEAKKSGGIIKAQNSAKLISKINQSNANFVKRLLDPNRKVIQNWVNPLDVSTHKLGWATEDTKQGAFVYPEVQEINGELIDFTHPSHRRSEVINSAIERRDTVRMTPEQAKWFTENYKEHYPGFQDGGNIHIKPENKGKFTDYCGGKVTEECIQRGKHSSNPTTRKRATFAANARTWKHQEGGILDKFNHSKLGKTLDWIDLGADVLSMSGIPVVSQAAGVVGMITGIPQAGLALVDYAQKAKNGDYKPTLDQAVALSKLVPTANLWKKAGTAALLSKSGPKILRGMKPYKILSKWIPNGINLGSDIYEIADH